MMTQDAVIAFWQRFLIAPAAQQFADPTVYDTMSVGSDKAAADAGAALILKGRKTATSSLPSDYTGDIGPPYIGALSVVLDGSGAPVAIVETVEVVVRRIADLDADFARDYGEWDGTLKTLKAELAGYYGASDATWSLQSAEDLALLCERFRLVYVEKP